MCEVYSKDWFIQNIDKLENAYFSDGKPIDGIPIKPTESEEEKCAEKCEHDGVVNTWVAAWKMGRLDEVKDNGELKDSNRSTIPNGYGKPIEFVKLTDYLGEINYADRKK